MISLEMTALILFSFFFFFFSRQKTVFSFFSFFYSTSIFPAIAFTMSLTPSLSFASFAGSV